MSLKIEMILHTVESYLPFFLGHVFVKGCFGRFLHLRDVSNYTESLPMAALHAGYMASTGSQVVEQHLGVGSQLHQQIEIRDVSRQNGEPGFRC